jgi:hypothetical protein
LKLPRVQWRRAVLVGLSGWLMGKDEGRWATTGAWEDLAMGTPAG